MRTPSSSCEMMVVIDASYCGRAVSSTAKDRKSADERTMPLPKPMKSSIETKTGNGGATERTTQPVDMAAEATRSETWRPKWCRKNEAEMDERK